MSIGDRGSVVAAIALSAALAITTFGGGGFDAAAKGRFVALAGVALLAAAMLDSRTLVAAARSRMALALAATGVVALASCLWTVDGAGAALREGLVAVGLAAVFVAASTLATRTGPRPFAAAIAALALIEALVGLHAVAMHTLPDAERIYGVWRPGGTFQYPPALAILVLSALPFLRAALEDARSLLAGAAAAAITLIGAVLGLCGSRLALAMAAVLLVSMMLRGARGHRSALAAAFCTLLGASLAKAILGGRVPPYTAGAGWPGLLELAGLALGAGLAWTAMRGRAPGFRRTTLISCVAGIAVAVGAGLSVAPLDGVRAGPTATRASSHDRSGGLLHGREHEWAAALETWAERPLLGAGAGAYERASAVHQGADASRFAHDLLLELAAELGVVGLLLAAALYVAAGQLIHRSRSSPGWWLLAPTAFMFLTSNLVDWTWHLTGLTAVWCAACGALEGARRTRVAARADGGDACTLVGGWRR